MAHHGLAYADWAQMGNRSSPKAQRPISLSQIKALEEDFGVRLLERGRTKQVTLTEAGQSYLPDARRIFGRRGRSA